LEQQPIGTAEPAATAVDENHVMAERRAKLAKLRAQGQAFPNDFVPADRAAPVLATHADTTREALEQARVAVSIAGRMVLKRVQGKASFATVQDATGRLQLWINDEGVGADAHEAFKHWDLGDIVAAEGQSIGNALNYGGPYVGLFACKQSLIRQMPGRLCGETVDADGERGFVLTLSTREQHIRREKATSNICTAQVLLAVMAGMYAVWHGPEGLTRIAKRVRLLTRLAGDAASRLGFTLRHQGFFDTIELGRRRGKQAHGDRQLRRP
jgi:hypothetical protein